VTPRQIPLPLPGTPDDAAPFLADASNAEARAWLAAPARWPAQRLALWGAAGVGKSHLLREAAAALGLARADGASLRGVPEPRALALDDADLVPEAAALFHLINANAASGLPLLLAGRAPPGQWRVALPDLASRLRATTAVELARPSEALCAALLARHLAERQLSLPSNLAAWLLLRLPREAGAIAEAVARLDRLSLAAGRLTRPAITAVLADLLDGDDGSMESDSPASRGGVALL
jgi:chromosomal replication initiation ATPase DnaA